MRIEARKVSSSGGGGCTRTRVCYDMRLFFTALLSDDNIAPLIYSLLVMFSVLILNEYYVTLEIFFYLGSINEQGMC